MNESAENIGDSIMDQNLSLNNQNSLLNSPGKKSEQLSNDLQFEPSPRKNSKGNQSKMTRVKDLLRESQENALNMNKHDLDKMFNLELPNADDSSDRTSQQYFEKIKALR